MKKFFTLLLTAITAVCCIGAFAACEDKNETDKFTVYTSFYPIYDFTVKIAGDKADVVNLVPAGTEPHDYEPSTTDIQSMAKADLFIINGLGLETYADSIQDSINVKTVCATDGIETRTVDGVTDPHVWLSLKNAEKMLKNIADALSAVDSANADFYNENYEKYAVLFDALDAEYSSVLSACSRKDIVTAHAAFGYLCADYGLTQVPIEGLSAESEPDAAKMAEILDYVKNNGVTTIFYEELISPTVAESIATQTGAVTAVLNPLEGLSDADIAAGYDYLTEMADNLISLSKALGRAQ